MRTCIKSKCKLYYQQLHLKYLCNLARYWLQAPWGWHDSVETYRSVIIYEIIVQLLVIAQKKTLSVSPEHLNTWTCKWKVTIFCLGMYPSVFCSPADTNVATDSTANRCWTRIPGGESQAVGWCCPLRSSATHHLLISYATPRALSIVVTYTVVGCKSVLKRITPKNQAHISVINLALLTARVKCCLQ